MRSAVRAWVSAAEVDRGQRLLRGDRLGRPDRQAGAAQQAGEVHDVGGEEAGGHGGAKLASGWAKGASAGSLAI